MTQVSAVAAPPPAAAAEIFIVRLMVPGDTAFVTDSWLRSAWHLETRKLRDAGSGYAERMKAGRDWYREVRPRVTALLTDPATTVLVACERADADHIAGWVAIRGGVELRSHVKHVYRPWGVADLLRIAMEGEG